MAGDEGPDIPTGAQSPMPFIKSEPASPRRQEADIAQDDREIARESSNVEDTETLEMFCLKRLASYDSFGKLDNGVKVAVALLKALETHLDVSVDKEAVARWAKLIADLQAQAFPSRRLIGVVGNTGAGKSSLINAVLDEEQLVPTNCMRACTAVVTEISYNYSDDPEELYRAEIEFVSAEEWKKEVDLLFKELRDSNGNLSVDHNNAETDAGIAYAKIRAVYPYQTRNKALLAESSPETLLGDREVAKILGTVKVVKGVDAATLFGELKDYLDSTETHDVRRGRRTMATWPLIKVVRLYVKARALETGSVLVDLPGVQDSNAARSSIATKYMMQCSGLWVVAPITRAVDDKTAKTLLGNSFKLQLKMDGNYHNIAFICSKSDEISVSEAIPALHLDADVDQMRQQLRGIQTKIEHKNEDTRRVRSLEMAAESKSSALETQITKWAELEGPVIEGKEVYPPTSVLPRGGILGRLRKRKRCVEDSDDDAEKDDAEKRVDPLLGECGLIVDARERLTTEVLEKVLTGLVEFQDKVETKRGEFSAQITALEAEIAGLRAEYAACEERPRQMCIQARNEYSKNAIRNHFAAGLKELDIETATKEGDENYDPEESNGKDYQKIGHALPVFCISSRAYQQVRGRLKQDSPIRGFESTEGSEIPALQAHLREANMANRIAECQAFLNGVVHLLQTMMLWSSGADEKAKPTWGLSAEEKAYELSKIRTLLETFKDGIERDVSDAHLVAQTCINVDLGRSFASGVRQARRKAVEIVVSWRTLHWSSYKAICRRDGCANGRSGWKDFNDELSEPMKKRIANAWARCFSEAVPDAIFALLKTTNRRMESFREEAGTKLLYQRCGASLRRILEQEADLRAGAMAAKITCLTSQTNMTQREANREFSAAIQERMEEAYENCVNESGFGSYLRMKEHMEGHAEDHRSTMFQYAAEHVRGYLFKELSRINEDTCERLKSELDVLLAAWQNILMPAPVARASNDVLDAITNTLKRADDTFAVVLHAEET